MDSGVWMLLMVAMTTTAAQQDCRCGCPPNAPIPCANSPTACIAGIQFCDGVSNCPGGTDETQFDCSSTSCCAMLLSKRCIDNSACVPVSKICDGSSDCTDHSDEQCLPLCPSEDFSNGGWSEWVGSGCSTASGPGVETRTRTCTNPVPGRCGADCNGISEECVPCNIPSCSELCPPKHFRCSSEQCVKAIYLCDGKRDCDNGADEMLKFCRRRSSGSSQSDSSD